MEVNNQPAAKMHHLDKSICSEESLEDDALNETIKPMNTDKISERNSGELVLEPGKNLSPNNSCENTDKRGTVVENETGASSEILNPSSTRDPQILLSNTQSAGNEEFVTEEEVAESLKKKEENDSICLNGSYLSGSISQISGSLKTSKFDSSLNALMAKKNELIDSIKSVLANSSDNNLDTNVPEEKINNPNISILPETEGVDLKATNIGTSTPLSKSKPPAARFLKKWKPTFLNDEFQVIDEISVSEEEENGYEKAMASLKEVLYDTTADTASKLNSYSSMLDAFKEEDAKKYDSMMLTITSEKSSLEECLEDATKEVDEFIEEFSEKKIPQKNNDTVIAIDSKNDTLDSVFPLEEVMSLPPDDYTLLEDPKDITLVSVDSNVSAIGTTFVNDHIPTKPVENENTKVPNSENTESQVVPNENAPKEGDPDILIIAGDDDLDINVDDEDLLLASDEEGKDGKAETKKIQPQVPLIKDLEVFVSSDPNENMDNNNPKWNYLRNLGNDFEKYNAVRGRWKNIHIPNPKKDLTCRCRNPSVRFNDDLPVYKEARVSRKRPHSPDNSYQFSKKARRESCTMLFDRSIDQLANDVQNERMNLMNEQNQALHELAEIQQIEKMITMQKSGTKIDMQRLENKHIKETRNCIDEYRKRLNDTMNAAQAKLVALRKASDEVRQFHEFYPIEEGSENEVDSLVFLTDKEVQEILEVEEMLLSFPSFYNA